MKIAKHYQPELIVAKGKEPNPILTDPYLDAKESKLVATNGHAMIVLPVETEKNERSRYLACSLLKAARQLGDEDVPAEIIDQEITEFGVLWPAAQERSFVDWQKAVREAPRRGDQGSHTIKLNAKLVKALGEAMGTAGGVALTFLLESPEAPIRVEPVLPDPEEFGLLMPLAPDGEEEVDPDQRCSVCKRLLAAGAKCPDHPDAPEAVLDALADLGRSKDGRRVSMSVNGGPEADLTAFAEKRDAEKKRKRLKGQADDILMNAGSGDLVKKELDGDAVAPKKKGGRR